MFSNAGRQMQARGRLPSLNQPIASVTRPSFVLAGQRPPRRLVSSHAAQPQRAGESSTSQIQPKTASPHGKAVAKDFVIQPQTPRLGPGCPSLFYPQHRTGGGRYSRFCFCRCLLPLFVPVAIQRVETWRTHNAQPPPEPTNPGSETQITASHQEGEKKNRTRASKLRKHVRFRLLGRPPPGQTSLPPPPPSPIPSPRSRRASRQ